MECRDCGKKVSYLKFRDTPWYKIRCEQCQQKNEELEKRIWFKLGRVFPDTDPFDDKEQEKEINWWEIP